MEKKSLIKYLGLMGLTLASASCEKLEKDSLNESLDSQIPLKSSQTAKTGFTPIMEITLPDFINDQIIALSILAQDIFENPAIAQSFSQNPQEYFASKGLSGCNIDMNSGEVKAILALGDPEIRSAIESNDLVNFFRLLEEKKYISLDNMYSNSPIKTYIESQIKANGQILADLPPFENSPFFVVSAIVQSNIGTYVVSNTQLDIMICVRGHDVQYRFNNPVLKIWGIKNNSTDTPIVNELIERNLDKLVEAIENMNTYQQSNFKMKHEDLKNWLRKPLTQSFIDNY